MAGKAFSFWAAGRRGRPRPAAGPGPVIVVAAVIAWAGTACTAAPSRPAPAGSTPPAVMVLKQGAGNGNGDIFIAPQGGGSAGGPAGGPEIISTTGKVIWFHSLLPGEVATDFRTQTYQGKPVLSWWQGAGFGGLSTGTDYIYNDRYEQIAEVNAGNGYSADGHEFLIKPWNTALIVAFTTATANLTSIGGPADQAVIDGIVQEIDISTGKVLFQWNSADHVPYATATTRCLARRPPCGTGSTSTPSTSTPTGTC